MSRRRKIFLGLLTAWPLVYVVLFMLTFIGMFILGPLTATAGDGGPPALFFGGFGVIFAGHIFTMLLQFGLLFFFLWHLFKRKDLETNTQLLWALLIFMGGPIGQLIYWWKEIWSEPSGRSPATSTGMGAESSAGIHGAQGHSGHDGRP